MSKDEIHFRNSGSDREDHSGEPELQSFYTKKVRIKESKEPVRRRTVLKTFSERDEEEDDPVLRPGRDESRPLRQRPVRQSAREAEEDDDPVLSTFGSSGRDESRPLRRTSQGSTGRLSGENPRRSTSGAGRRTTGSTVREGQNSSRRNTGDSQELREPIRRTSREPVRRASQEAEESFRDPAKEAGKSFLIHGGILAAASIIVRIIGLIYRIPMIRIIGTEGIAYYSSAYKIYSIMLLVSSYSMPLAVSKLVSARLSQKKYKDGFKVISGAFWFSLVVGGLCSAVVFVFADQFATYILNMPLAAIPLRVLAPAIFIMSFLGVFRGFFQGLNTMIPTATSQIFEQIVNAAVSVGMSWWLFQLGHKADLVKGTLENGASLGAAGGTLGTTMGALTALLFCMFMYFRMRPGYRKPIKADRASDNESMGQVLKMLVLTIFPVLISTTAYNLIDIADQSVFSYYMSGRELLAEYKLIWGAYDGMYILMLHVPVAISSALASSSVPAITTSMAVGNTRAVISKVKGAIRFTMLISFPCAVGLGVLADPIMNSLFSGNEYHDKAAIYLTLGCIAVVFFSLATVTNGILQGMGRMAVPVRHALIALVIHLIMMVPMLWIFDMHIYAVILSYIAFGMVMSFLNLVSIENELDMDLDLKKTFVMPAVASLIMGLAVLGVSYIVREIVGSDKMSLIFGMLTGVVAYAVLLFGLGMISSEDLEDMPKGRSLARMAEKLHLLRD
ncbi:MAG: oligosaccharide flippase family protein [Lachnospiraceae bacterium]|nr:oligosaccharide flippase family protein [Lachnospiraceae bacterium]